MFHPFVIVFITSSFAVCAAFNLQCKFEHRQLYEIAKSSSCLVQNLTLLCMDQITTINGLSQYDFAKEESIKTIEMKNQNLRVFPSGLESFSRDIEAIQVYNSPLREIKKENIGVFRKLKRLLIENCELESLDGDLFQSNSEIRRVSFKGNKIKAIGAEIFKSNQFLNYVDLANNLCIHRDFKSHTEVVEFQLEVNLMCPTYEAVKMIIETNRRLKRMLDVEGAPITLRDKITREIEEFDDYSKENSESVSAKGNSDKESCCFTDPLTFTVLLTNQLILIAGVSSVLLINMSLCIFSMKLLRSLNKRELCVDSENSGESANHFYDDIQLKKANKRERNQITSSLEVQFKCFISSSIYISSFESNQMSF
jgi:hypothetical protein